MSKNYLLSPYAFDIQFRSEQNVIIALRQSIPFDLSTYNETQTKLLKMTIGAYSLLDTRLRESLADCITLILNDLELGDRIVFPINKETFIIGSIDEDYLFDESAHFQHQRLAFWKSTVILNSNGPLSEEIELFRGMTSNMMDEGAFLYAIIRSEVFSSLEAYAVPANEEATTRRSILHAIENRTSDHSAPNDCWIYHFVCDNKTSSEDLIEEQMKCSGIIMSEESRERQRMLMKASPNNAGSSGSSRSVTESYDEIDTIPDEDNIVRRNVARGPVPHWAKKTTSTPYLFDEIDNILNEDNQDEEHLTFMDKVRNIFKRKSKPEPLSSSFPEKPDAQDSSKEQLTHFATLAPNEIYPGYWRTVQVYLFPIESWGNVQALAHNVDPEAKVKGFKPLSLILQMNDRITCELECFDKGVTIPEASEDMIWKGEMLSTSFLLKVPEHFKEPTIALRVIVSVNGAPVGQMMLTMRVTDRSHDSFGPPLDLHQYAHIESKSFNKVFISYSHIDKSWAELLAEVYHLHGLEYFLDSHSLEAGDVVDESILGHIDESDLFLLLWSENAEHSDYVRKEYLHAMARAYPQLKKDEAKISIKPLVITPPADPPADMKQIYHFKRIHG